jgi:magnesium transporter
VTYSPSVSKEIAVPHTDSASGCAVFGVEFDFANRKEQGCDLARAKAAMEEGRFVWLDVDVQKPEEARTFFNDLGLVVEEIVDDALTREPATQISKYDEYLHLVMTGCRLTEQHFDLERVDLVVAENFLLTIHRGPVVFLEIVKKRYKADFYRFAKSPSFLLYELWDHLLENYLSVQKRFEERVERMQADLIGNVDDRVFGRMSELGADLLHFRKLLLPARAVLTELSTRKSPFVSEATQPFLGNMVGTVERVLQDLLVDRDILSESLNLYMSVVGHRTNRIMNKLTVVSVIFLPLTFLCGIWGMNFEIMPELHWRYGYLVFWGSVACVSGGLWWVMRRMRLL